MKKVKQIVVLLTKKHIALALTIGAFCTITLNSCYYDNFEELHPTVGLFDKCDTNHVISYATDIKLIMDNSCGTNNSCHAASNTSGYDFSTWAAFDAYLPASSTRFVSSVTWDNAHVSHMPKNATNKISDCNITQIKKWIAAGHPNN